MNHPKLKARPHRARRATADFPPLLTVMRDANLYPLVRALLSNGISRFSTIAPFTYPLEGNKVVLDETHLNTVVGSIGKAIGNPRLRVNAKRLRGLQRLTTLVLSQPAKQALLLEMAALLANLSGTDLVGLPPLDARQAGSAP